MTTTTNVPQCPRDGFPMVEIDGQLQCSAEYADRTIGGKRVQHLTERDGYITIEFATGETIPLTCPCCGGQLHLTDTTVEQFGRFLIGRTLEGFRHGEWVSREPGSGRHPIFALQFDGDEDRSARTVQVHLDSVRKITE
jgi:hypothetical protein